EGRAGLADDPFGQTGLIEPADVGAGLHDVALARARIEIDPLRRVLRDPLADEIQEPEVVTGQREAQGAAALQELALGLLRAGPLRQHLAARAEAAVAAAERAALLEERLSLLRVHAEELALGGAAVAEAERAGFFVRLGDLLLPVRVLALRGDL